MHITNNATFRPTTSLGSLSHGADKEYNVRVTFSKLSNAVAQTTLCQCIIDTQLHTSAVHTSENRHKHTNNRTAFKAGLQAIDQMSSFHTSTSVTGVCVCVCRSGVETRQHVTDHCVEKKKVHLE